MMGRVIRLDDMTVYPSAAGAAAAIGANRSSVIRAIREGRACKGVHLAALPAKLDGFDVSSDVVRMWCAGEVLRRSGVDVAMGAAEWADGKVDRMIKYGEE